MAAPFSTFLKPLTTTVTTPRWPKVPLRFEDPVPELRGRVRHSVDEEYSMDNKASYENDLSVTRRLRNRRLQKKMCVAVIPSIFETALAGVTPANNIGHRTKIAMGNLLRTLPMVLAKQAHTVLYSCTIGCDRGTVSGHGEQWPSGCSPAFGCTVVRAV